MMQLQEMACLGAYQQEVEQALADMASQRIVERIWQRDHTVWKSAPSEIANRLGWLDVAERTSEAIGEIEELVRSVQAEGYTEALLLGMGGSSLAPEVCRKTFGITPGYLNLAVLDSTHPEAVLAHADRLDLSRTLFVVSTKSGGTVETFSFFKFFYNRAAETLGNKRAGEHFIAITDPGSSLAGVAETLDFRKTFLNDPNVGGRYSAQSFFGMVPAALMGVDLRKLLQRVQDMSAACGPQVETANNPAAWLGAVLGELAKAGRDKVTLIISPQLASFGDWIEQLIAESTGKEGKGILPIVGESMGGRSVYGTDRLFVHLRLSGDDTYVVAIEALERAGQPVIRLDLRDEYDLGGQFFLWELATAVAGHRLGLNPFDQPNVEAAKTLARKMMAEYAEKATLPTLAPSLVDDNIMVYGDVTGQTAGAALTSFLQLARSGDYIAVQAYVQPTEEINEVLHALQIALRDRTGLAVTVGYGPRFLHSTGQLHKGDRGNGLFIQLTVDTPHDVSIPDEPGLDRATITFGVLIAAQAMGDRQALIDAGRRVIRFHLGTEAVGSIERLIGALL